MFLLNKFDQKLFKQKMVLFNHRMLMLGYWQSYNTPGREYNLNTER